MRGRQEGTITNMAVMHFDEVSKEMVLTSHHPGISVGEVLSGSGLSLTPKHLQPDLIPAVAPYRTDCNTRRRGDRRRGPS